MEGTTTARRVLAVASELDWVEVNMMAGIARAGWEVHCIVEPNARYGNDLEAAGISVSRLSLPGRLSLPAIRTIRAELRRTKYEILHCFSARALSNALIASRGIPLKRIGYRGTMGHVSRWDPTSWMTFLHPSLDRIHCVSDAVYRYLRRFLPSDRLVTIYKGHDPRWYTRAEERSLSEFEVPNDAFLISCVANMRPVKGVPVLLSAFDQLPDELNAHLLLIGRIDSDTEVAIKKNMRQGDRVHVTGFQDSPSKLVSQSDCFVQPSLDREGLPKSLLEAMCVGIAPIVTEVGGMPEVVKDGENGVVVPPNDSSALSRAIIRLAGDQNERDRLAKAARATIDQRFHIDQTVRELLRVYEELTT